MISVTEYVRHDALSLAGLVRRGEVSASELLEAAIARAERINPSINAIVTPMYELARERAAGALSGPLAGVPFLLKDLEQHYAGVPTSSGCKALRAAAVPAPVHSEITRRWLAAGLVVFGRTNTPEFGGKAITEPDAWGAARNPWQLDRSAGGSSGGAAAVVAAGIVPVAGASDGGGSIRIPAASTGLFGLKPGRGRTPWGPEMGELMHGAALNHVLSRTVRDSAVMLDVSHGPERGSWSRLAPPERPYLDEVTRDPGRLRIALSTRSPFDSPVDPEAVRAVESAARLLSGLGHHVEQAEPKLDGDALARDFLSMWFAHAAAQVEQVRKLTGCDDNGFELDTLAMAAIGRGMSAPDYVASYVNWNGYGRRLAEFFDDYDLYMTPALAEPAPRIGEVQTPAWAAAFLRLGLKAGAFPLLKLVPALIEKLARENLRRVPFTQLANVTGVPAMSVPLHVCANGLPLGVQLMADHGGEGLLFSLAAQLEQAQPWLDRLPLL